jgi:AAA+ superfamily predicted ATPase
MRDPRCRTAIVFSNGLDFLAHTDSAAIRSLTGRMTRWQQLTGLNDNICILLFPPLSTVDIEGLFGQRGGWAFLRAQMFSNDRLSSQTHMIGPPHPEEVGWLLERLRILHGKEYDVRERRALAIRLCRLGGATAGQLKRLYARLSSCTALTPGALAPLLGPVEQETALDRLRRMEGIEAVQLRVDQLLKQRREVDAFASVASVEAPPTFPTRLLPARALPNPVTLHMVLRGRPGTGKTTVAELLGDIYRDAGLLPIGHTVKVTRKDLVAEHIGGTALRTSERIEQAMGGVLFVDEAYQLSEGGERDFGKEAIETLMEAMSARNGQFAVVLAGYPEKMDQFLQTNPGLLRRYGSANLLTIADYKPPVLCRIFEDRARRDGRTFEPANWYRARDPVSFGNAGDVLELYAEMDQRRASRVVDVFAPDARVLTLADIPERLRHHTLPSPGDADEILAALGDIVGLAVVKNQIRTLFNRVRLSQKRGRGPGAPGHYRFEGPPGTGKTTVARRMGTMFRVLGLLERGHVVSCGRVDLVGSYQGHSAERTRAKVEEALDGVLFVDEAYQLTLDPQDTFGREAAGTLLHLMEEHRQRLTVIIAGYPSHIERFISSNDGFASRFTHRFDFQDYTPEEMLRILEVMVQAEGLRATPEFLASSLAIFEDLARTPDPALANGRGVRTILERPRAP